MKRKAPLPGMPCDFCGAVDTNSQGRCRPCLKAWAAKRGAELAGAECAKCRTAKRYSNGRCVSCSSARSRAWKKAHPGHGKASTADCDRRRKGWLPGESDRAEAARPHARECACCGVSRPNSKLGWHADHDHSTGKFRAFLCHKCNIALGYLEGVTPDRAAMFAAYLTKHGSPMGVLSARVLGGGNDNAGE